MVRTTLTLDEDLAVLLREEAARSRRPFRQVVNQAIRTGLRTDAAPQARRPFEVRGHSFRMRPGFDPDKLGQLADQLEADALVFENAERPPPR
jgi:hypothetical protein